MRASSSPGDAILGSTHEEVRKEDRKERKRQKSGLIMQLPLWVTEE